MAAENFVRIVGELGGWIDRNGLALFATDGQHEELARRCRAEGVRVERAVPDESYVDYHEDAFSLDEL